MWRYVSGDVETVAYLTVATQVSSNFRTCSRPRALSLVAPLGAAKRLILIGRPLPTAAAPMRSRVSATASMPLLAPAARATSASAKRAHPLDACVAAHRV